MQDPNHKSLRKFVSPFLSIIPRVSESSRYGIFHTALIVGPFYLGMLLWYSFFKIFQEWNDSSLCIPRKIGSSKAILTADVCTLDVTREMASDITAKIADVLVDWNVHFKYHNASILEKPFTGNCQDMVDSIFRKIDVKPVFSGALGSFLTSLRQKGAGGLHTSVC